MTKRLYLARWLCLTMALLLTLVVLASCAMSDEAKYKNAQSMMAKGDYAGAAKAFEELGSYEEASKLTMYCKATAAGERGDYETAYSGFKSLGEYKDSPLMISYYEAREYEGGNWRSKLQAAKLFDQISLFRDGAARAENCRKIVYEEAQSLKSAGDYDGACNRLEALGYYQSASGQIPEIRYKQGEAKRAAKDWDGAVAAFKQAGRYSDAVTQVEETRYMQAETLETEGKREEASKLFVSLGDYKDSFERAYGPYYGEGLAKREAKDWDGAVSAFQKAGKYSDAAMQIKETRYIQAEALESEGNRAEASKLFASLGAYRDAFERAYKPYYDEGLRKREAKDWDGSVMSFQKAGNYSDAKTQILETKYQKAIELRASGKYDEAIAEFIELVDYKDSAAQANETRYQLADKMRASGKFSEAYSIYTQIAGYKDVDSLLANDHNLAAAAARDAKYSMGNYVTFGHYPQTSGGNDYTEIEWLVLARDGNKVLLISRYGLDAKPYNEKAKPYSQEIVDITWEKCTLRTWLNGTFLNKAFTAQEQKGILTTTVDNSKSQGYSKWSTSGGNNTQDRIFLLSYAEANKYLGVTYDDSKNTKSRVAPTAYAIKQGAFTYSSNKTADGTAAGSWWLRSPGLDQSDATFVNSGGALYSYYGTYDSGCVRPALWINLESDIF